MRSIIKYILPVLAGLSFMLTACEKEEIPYYMLSVTTESTSHSYAILVPDGCENLSGVTRATLEIGYPAYETLCVTLNQIIYVDYEPVHHA